MKPQNKLLKKTRKINEIDKNKTKRMKKEQK